ncbi:MAG: hypothetical protein QM796_11070 [Chthoniobacteraceae bacterium]
MEPTNSLVSNQGPGARGRAVCGITIIYEDPATALRAKKFSDQLIETMGGEMDREASSWRSAQPGIHMVKEEVTQNPSAGEFLVISLRGDTRLSPKARHPIRQWLETSADRSLCMIALFDGEHCDHPAMHQTRQMLQSLTAGAGIALFIHFLACEPVEKTALHQKELSPHHHPSRSKNSLRCIFPRPPLAVRL